MDYYLGEIRMFAGPYAPENWLYCDGTLLSIADNQALYSLLGTVWGGDGVKNFALPDLRGRLPVGQGQGPTLSARPFAQKGGQSAVQLGQANMPAHTHAFNVCNQPATVSAPAQNLGLAAPATTTPGGTLVRYAPAGTSTTVGAFVAASVTTANGGSTPHNNLMPYYAMNYIICVHGMYPDKP
jgi:microcystin-dependent protein